MEEDINENDLEEKLYALLHHVDETQPVSTQQDNGIPFQENTIVTANNSRRYWNVGEYNTHYSKVNVPSKHASAQHQKHFKQSAQTTEGDSSCTGADLSIFQQPVPKNLEKDITILDNDNLVVELESSDEDEVVEVALPPKPTITIDSSDEDAIQVSPNVTTPKIISKPETKTVADRESTSPVPSVVSSASDEFIRGDCIALNISSKRPNSESFDFSLHGSDLLGDSTLSKNKKKKKNKDSNDSTDTIKKNSTNSIPDQLFATPKSKAKNRKQKQKSYSVTEKSVPNADVYDSDSNQSTIEVRKSANVELTEKEITNVDLYESDSSASEITNKTELSTNNGIEVNSLNNISPINASDKLESWKNANVHDSLEETIDLTINNGPIEEDFTTNIIGFTEPEQNRNEPTSKSDDSYWGSTNIPAILNEDLNFNGLNGRHFSLTALRAEMKKFYNESWGGEEFNHREILKHMPRDKHLWVIDAKDKMPMPRRKPPCNICNRIGHRDNRCRFRPIVCHMCGFSGHEEPRCPRKICMKCGAPGNMYTPVCIYCYAWDRTKCNECGRLGHPASHCPDTWRRYHNTIDLTTPLEESRQTKKHWQLFCSGCARRGHLVHTCRSSVPFSSFPVQSPYVNTYRHTYQIPDNRNNNQQDKTKQDTNNPPPIARDNKRQSKSPITHGTNKKRLLSDGSNPQTSRLSQNKEPDFIEVAKDSCEKQISANHDKKGQMIQDNEVSDTSDVLTSARLYITGDMLSKLTSKEGEEWRKEATKQNSVTVDISADASYIYIKGKFVDQEAFQTKLREWFIKDSDKVPKNDEKSSSKTEKHLLNIPKKADQIITFLCKSFKSLEQDLGDPKEMFKELNFLQKRQKELLQKKQISPQQLDNNRTNINRIQRKLNMVLVGQAGLADGGQHLNQLYCLRNIAKNFTHKILPSNLRHQVGKNYHFIFTDARDDYAELISKYYGSYQRTAPNNSMEDTSNPTAKMQVKNITNVILNTIPTPTNNIIVQTNGENPAKSPAKKYKNKYRKKKLNNSTVDQAVKEPQRQLFSIYQRLLKTRPLEPIHKKDRITLVRKLHSHLAASQTNDKISAKAMKKMRKDKAKAEQFLTNV